MGKKEDFRQTGRNNVLQTQIHFPCKPFSSTSGGTAGKRFRQALKARRYAEAESLYRKITEARKEHRLWIDRSEKVRIR